MAFHNANYEIVPLSSSNGPNVLGNGISASTVHEVFCTSDGEVEIVAIGGGSMTVTLSAGQSVSILCSSVNVNSGSFVGFRSKHTKGPMVMNG